MDHFNGKPTYTKVEAYNRKYNIGPEDKREWTNSYESIIEIMLYLESNTRQDIYFVVNNCSQFTHNIKESHETDVKRICKYIHGTH